MKEDVVMVVEGGIEGDEEKRRKGEEEKRRRQVTRMVTLVSLDTPTIGCRAEESRRCCLRRVGYFPIAQDPTDLDLELPSPTM